MKIVSIVLFWTLAAAGVVDLVFVTMIGFGYASVVPSGLNEALDYVLILGLWAFASLGALYETSVAIAGPAAAWTTAPVLLAVMDRDVGLARWQEAIARLYDFSVLGCVFWAWLLMKRLDDGATPRS
jgi:hypothetical protein